MKFFFIDESDKQQNKDNRYFFALCGLIVDKDNLVNLNSELEALKVKYDLPNLKKLRGNHPEKDKITSEIFKILKSNNTKAMSAILGTKTYKGIESIDDAYLSALYFLTERFLINLRMEGKCGIVVSDSLNRTTEKKLRKEFHRLISEEEFRMYGKKKGDFRDNIYPCLFFSNDEHTAILQASDLITTSLNSAFWDMIQKEGRNLESLPERCKYLKKYWPLFIKSPRGNVSGWGIKVWW